MAASQDSHDKYRKISRRLKEVQLELDDVRQRQDVIIAKHRTEISLDASWDKADYNERPKLREAALILRLEDDPEYQATRKRERELRLEKNDLEVEIDLVGAEVFGKFPLKGLSLGEDDSDLDNL
jgi:hypothetical protein